MMNIKNSTKDSSIMNYSKSVGNIIVPSLSNPKFFIDYFGKKHDIFICQTGYYYYLENGNKIIFESFTPQIRRCFYDKDNFVIYLNEFNEVCYIAEQNQLPSGYKPLSVQSPRSQKRINQFYNIGKFASQFLSENQVLFFLVLSILALLVIYFLGIISGIFLYIMFE